MSKPKYIQANYTRTIEFNLEELGIDWDKVRDVSKDVWEKVKTSAIKIGRAMFPKQGLH